MADLPINWGLARNPQNWVRVTLMVLIAGVAFDIVASPLLKKEG